MNIKVETPVGGDAIRKTKPTNIYELAIINSLMRLMASEGSEMPIDSYIKNKENITYWYDEMTDHGLTEEEQEIMKSYLALNYGVADSQELAMLLVMDKRISGFSLSEADKLRKGIAKKKPEIVEELRRQFFDYGMKLGTSENLLRYVWYVQLAKQFGYSFSSIHTYSYSILALIELNINYHFPPIFWNTACLIVDSAGVEDEMTEEPEKEEEDENEDETEEIDETTKKKKKSKPMKYGKISTAIGKIRGRGIEVAPPDINKSNFSFTPDVTNNRIVFGIKGIARINSDLAKTIIANRPYNSLQNFLEKVKVTKPQIINLIKSGAFDEIETCSREEIMDKYIDSISGKKTKLTLQNMATLIRYNLIPEEHYFEARLFNFNKYLKKSKIGKDFYILDDTAKDFYEQYFDVDDLYFEDEQVLIAQKVWDKTYSKAMDPMRQYLKESDILDRLNEKLYEEAAEKYCEGNISKWEMDSISFYYHEHELASVNNEEYSIRNFFDEPENPVVVATNTFKGRTFPIYDLYRIAGTVLDRDKTKRIVTLLTPNGVVPVKVYQAQFTKYDKQISIKLPDGKKKVMEKSWFSRGNKLMVTGFKRNNDFIPKIYKRNCPFEEPFRLITQVNEDGTLESIGERFDGGDF